jgi:hypothetical protein
MGSLAAIDEVTMLCMPDLVTLVNGDDTRLRDVQGKVIAHCEAMGDRMAILDAPPDMIPQDILEWRRDRAGYDTKYGTLYWPWIEVMDPLAKRPIMIPPSGHVAGVWARTDATRGVHKAPANEVVMAANGLAFQITQAEQGALNQQGINCIRSFPGRGIRIWGARTLSSDPEWRYLNVRRLFNYISESIVEGTQWAVFEPNDDRLWLRLRVAVGNFLTLTWRGGALFGASPSEAFYVKCDQPDRRDRGGTGRHRGRHLPRQAGGVRRLPHQPVLGRRRRGRGRRVTLPPEPDEEHARCRLTRTSRSPPSSACRSTGSRGRACGRRSRVWTTRTRRSTSASARPTASSGSARSRAS